MNNSIYPEPERLAELHSRAVDGFGARVDAVTPGQWSDPTPCADWDVRTLVNHVVGENVWTAPLFEGATIAEVGDRFDGDLLGDDPKEAWADSAGQAKAAVSGDGALGRTVHLSFGDTPAPEYVMQLTADYVVHAWDLARAVGADERLDPELVDVVATWFAEREDAYRSAGAIGPKAETTDGADAQAHLLAVFGRSS
jgi:uncharacterized protein (TIGR03086 family)